MNVTEPLLLPKCPGRAAPFVLQLVLPIFLVIAADVRAQTDGGAMAPRLLSVSNLDSSMVIDVRYATEDNFVGGPIEGYREPLCLLTPEAAAALVRANAIVAEQGYRLVVFDCYRPQRAVDHFVRWSYYPLDQKTKSTYYPNVEKRLLFELGYIASKSGHSRASTVDVSLAIDGERGQTGEPVLLDMGTRFDFFDALSHTDTPDIGVEPRRNRQLLVEAMSRAGFRNYSKEWWHFTLVDEPYPDQYFDVVVASESVSNRQVKTE